MNSTMTTILRSGIYVAVVRSNRTFDLVEPKIILCLGT